MMRRWRRWGICGAISSVLVLGAAAVASGAASGNYRGRTSQKRRVSLTYTGGKVRKLKVVVNTKCPDGHTLVVAVGFLPMKVTKARFHASFTPAVGPNGERSSVSGRIRRASVTGTITDTTFSNRERQLCHGSATFITRHV